MMGERITRLGNNCNVNQLANEQPQTNQTPTNQTQTDQRQTDPPEDYIVRRGDTLTVLASRRGILIRDILRDNPQITNPNRIYIGQHLRLPADARSVSYTVRRGDTLSGIARHYDTTAGDIHRANRGQISDADLIYPGQRLRIPTGQGTAAPTGTNETRQPPTQQPPPIQQTPQTPPVIDPPLTQPPTDGQTPPVMPRGELRLGVNEEYREALLLAERRTGIDAAALAGVIDAEAAKDRETGRWLPDSQASTSSARGLTQFTDDTWVAQARIRGSYLNETALQRGFISPTDNGYEVLDRTALLALRDDPTLSIVSAAEHGRDNLARLERNGFLPANLSDDEKAKYMYYAHHEGYAGATRHLTDSRTADENAARRVLETNRAVVRARYGTTVDEFVERHNGSYREAYQEFAESEARRIFPIQVGRRTVNQYVERHGSHEQGYRAWLNDYTDARIQPSRYREAANEQTPPVQETENNPAPPPTNGEPSRHLRFSNTDIRLSPLVERKMSQIADEYHRLTGRNLTVTDGDRTARDQADRMYARFRGGNFGGYLNRTLLAEITAAYREGERRGESPLQIRDRMAQTIQNQTDRGQYISRHLVGQGADVRIRDMSASDRAAFLRAVETIGGATQLNEGDHWHIQVDPNAR